MTARQVSLHNIAPRLAKARDQFLEHRAEQWRLDLVFADRTLEARRLIAHRELQLIRAEATGRSRYIDWRHKKLEAAWAELAEIERQNRERLAA